ncbi:sugar phosphate permease [Burkholderia sp. Ch1-1]|nr:sugar phosphate permease [Burkholderia sp. Ch1-1]
MSTVSNRLSSGNAQTLARAYRSTMAHTLPLLFLCYLCNYLDRINVGFAKLQMVDDLKMSETAFGLGAGIFFIGYVIAGVPSSLALRKLRPRQLMSILMMIWGTLSASLLFVRSPAAFYALRFLTGVAEAGFFPSIVLYFSQWYPAKRRGEVMSLFMVSIPVSGLLGGPLSGWMLQQFSASPGGMAGWQWLYLLQGAPTVLLGFVLLVLLKDDPSKAHWLDDAEKRLLFDELADERGASLERAAVAPQLRNALLNPTVLTLGAAYFCIQMGVYALNFWLPSIVRSLGFANLGVIGWISAVPYLFASIAMVVTGKSSDTRGERRLHLGVPLLAGFAGLLVAAGSNGSVAGALGGLTLATAGTLTGLAMFWPYTASVPERSPSAAGIALINSMGQLAGFAGPYVVGLLKDVTHRTTPALYLLSSALAIGALIVVLAFRAGAPRVVAGGNPVVTD